MTMELSKAIKVALKTKANKELTTNQKKARAILHLHGYKFEPCRYSEQGYMQIVKNNRAVYISMIADTSKAGVFIDDENNHERCLNRDFHTLGCEDRDFKKLRDIFPKIDFINLFNKTKFPKIEYKRTALDEAKYLKFSCDNVKKHLEWDKDWLDKAKKEYERCYRSYVHRTKVVKENEKKYRDFLKKHLKS